MGSVGVNRETHKGPLRPVCGEEIPLRPIHAVVPKAEVLGFEETSEPMPSKRKYSKKKLVVIPFVASLSISALADADVVAGDILSADVDEDFHIWSIKCNHALDGMTAGEGPIQVGFAHGGYSATEIEEALEVVLTSQSDLIDAEKANRLVRKVGYFGVRNASEDINQGRPIKTKLNWNIGNPQGNIRMWAFNQSGAQLAAGGTYKVFGEMYGYWK